MRLKASMRLRNAAMIEWRKEKGFNQPEAAAFCGVSKNTWMRLEKLHYPKHYPERTVFAIVCATLIDIDKIMPEELRGQNFGKTFSQEIEATNNQLRALASYQSHYCERSLLAAPDDTMAQKELANALRKSVATLTPYHQQIINMRYGLDGSKPLSQKVVGKILRRNRTTIKQAERDALQCLRDERRTHMIELLL